jgi:hypothetical protein
MLCAQFLLQCWASLLSDTNVIDAASFNIITLVVRALSITLNKSAPSIMTLNADTYCIIYAECTIFTVILSVVMLSILLPWHLFQCCITGVDCMSVESTWSMDHRKILMIIFWTRVWTWKKMKKTFIPIQNFRHCQHPHQVELKKIKKILGTKILP